MFWLCLILFQLPAATAWTTADKFNSRLRGRVQEALTETGIIVVTGIPGMKELRRSVLLGTHLCSKVASAAKTVEFDDHTQRTTLAAVAEGLDGQQELHLGDISSPEQCSDGLLEDIREFRTLVGEGRDPCKNISLGVHVWISLLVNVWNMDHDRTDSESALDTSPGSCRAAACVSCIYGDRVGEVTSLRPVRDSVPASCGCLRCSCGRCFRHFGRCSSVEHGGRQEV